MSARHSGYRRKDENILVMIFEHDIDDPLRSSGAIIMEQYVADSPEQVMDRAQGFADSGKHGLIWVGEVNPVELRQVRPINDTPDSVEIGRAHV